VEGMPPMDLPVDAAYPHLVRLLRRAWRLHWENMFKEVLWRLTLDAVRHPHNAAMRGESGACVPPVLLHQLRTAVGLPPAAPVAGQLPFHLVQLDDEALAATQQLQPPARAYPCSCGQDQCSRAHHFHACPVAQAVFAAVESLLPAAARPLRRHHLWLCMLPCAPAPHPPMCQDVWDVVCLSALTAMEVGRCRLYAEHKAREAQRAATGGLRQRRITELMPGAAGAVVQYVPPPSPVEVACRRAVAELWACLQNFVAKGLPERSARRWRNKGVGRTHPFLGVDDEFRVVLNNAVPAGNDDDDDADADL
jgi:hypothetical protein